MGAATSARPITQQLDRLRVLDSASVFGGLLEPYCPTIGVGK